MKNIRSTMDNYIDELDERWQALPARKQCRYICYFLIAYLLLAAGSIFKVWYDIQNPNHEMVIKSIENPVLQKDERPGSLKSKISTDNPKPSTYEKR